MRDFRIECELVAGVWDHLYPDVLSSRTPVTWRRGIFGHGPLDRVAEPGTMTFALDNAARNATGRPAWVSSAQGRYSPGHANIWTDANSSSVFRHGTRVRLRMGLDYNYRELILAHNPIAYYRMDATSGTSETNLTGYTNPGQTPGTYAGGFTLIQDGVTADGNLAVDFDVGSSGRMTTPLDETDIPNTAWTLEAWIKTSTTGTNKAIISRYNGAASRPVLWVTGANVAQIRSNDGTTTSVVTGTTNVCDGEWHHVAATYDGTTIRLYVDGSSEGSPVTANGFDDGTTATFNVGEFNSGSYFDGLIDEVGIYDYALSASQLKEHYEAISYAIGYADMVLYNNPVAFYRLGTLDAGTTAVDHVGLSDADSDGANPGTHVNTPTLGASGALSDDDTAVTYASASSEHTTTPLDETNVPNTGWGLSAWVNTSTTGSQKTIIARYNGSASRPLLWITSGNVAEIRSNDGTTTKVVTGTTNVCDGAWHFIVATYDGTTLRLYVDGASEGTPTAANGFDTGTTAPFSIGEFNSGDYFNGTIDEAAFFDYGLTSTQIATLYAARTSTLNYDAGVITYVFSGKLTDIHPTPGTTGTAEVACVAQDWMAELSETQGLLVVNFTDPTVYPPSSFASDTSSIIDDVIDLVDRAPENQDLDTAFSPKTVFVAFDDLGGRRTLAVNAAQRVCQTDMSTLVVRENGTDGETVEYLSAESRNGLQTPNWNTPTFTESELAGIDVPSAKNRVINDVTVRVWPRSVDASNVVLAGPLAREYPVADGNTVEIWVGYSNPNEEGQIVGAQTIVTPVANTDYTANDTAGGGGTDVTASVTSSVTAFGSRAKMGFANASGGAAFVRGPGGAEGPQLRGKGIYRDEATEFQKEDATSIAKYGRRDVVVDMYYNLNFEAAEGFALSIRDAYKELANIPTTVTPQTVSHAVLRKTLGVKLLDAITVSESLTAVDAVTVLTHAVEGQIFDAVVSITWHVAPPMDLTPQAL